MAAANHISVLDYNNTRFLITDRPTDATIKEYLKVLKENEVTALVRVCEPTYNTKPLEEAGITIFDWPFEDGDPPSSEVIGKWLDLVQNTKGRIAVHCVAGLGRAPVMVAISLMEQGLDAEDAVAFIRDKRRGAINRKQLDFLHSYKPHKKGGKGCLVM